MCNKHINRLSLCEKFINDLYVIDSMVKLTKRACEAEEYSSEYYGETKDFSKKLSAERNNYINSLSVISEKISELENYGIYIEHEISLQKNSNNCC